MTKTLAEIIDAVRDGQRPDYEDLRYAICAMEALATFDSQSLLRLAAGEMDGKKPFLVTSPKWQFQESMDRRRRALMKPPKEWVGWSNDPDNPEFLARRKASQAMFKKLAKKADGEEA